MQEQLTVFLILAGSTFLWIRIRHRRRNKPSKRTRQHRSFRLTKNLTEQELAMQEEEEIANGLESIGKSIRGLGLIALFAWITGG